MILSQKVDQLLGARSSKFAQLYPDACSDCGNKWCTCPPVLGSTIGRITHEVPTGRGVIGEAGRFMPVDEARRMFKEIV